ncbi:hypothetical protein MSSIT_2741 [Methanosarcina siciliae T4/M]|uniref:Uncharacterized protein n=2 Tax=Methanosarcina siciliae TaxID=38027 RepID=A0A0E3PFJ8_9EURY|nr:hypothetical protein [Methanosarcina siciliae]AKB29460.1 hypothetical protein MSSIT_2741 [Methanosarcina siciliae T4/M]AKB33395.1 hypothetical protein MSSIH_2705 [Methanosarcina siciliae HI350]
MGIEKSEEGIVRCSESKRSIEKSEKEPMFVLIVADDGNEFPHNIDFRNTDSLGLRLVNILKKAPGRTTGKAKTTKH